MNIGYEETGATVLVQDENKNKRELVNKANIEGILLLENERARVEKLVNAFEEVDKSSDNKVKSYVKHHHSFFSAVGAVAIAAFTGKVILPIFNPDFYLETGPLSLFGIGSAIALLHTKSVGYYNWKKEREDANTKNNKINLKLKNTKLLKFAINRELKVERNADLPADRIAGYKDITNSKLIKIDAILNDYEQNHDQFIKNYKENEELPYYKDKLYGRLISDMIQKEVYDEKKKDESSIIDLAKNKVKSILK